MIEKTLSHGIKVLKFSTWISVIVGLLIVLITAFFVTFPALLKTPIEDQLSAASGLHVNLEKVTFDFEQKGLVLKVHDINVTSLEQRDIASIDSLRWKIELFSLFDDVYNPSDVYLNTLTIYPDTNTEENKFGIHDIKQLVSKQNLRVLNFFKSLTIQKTLIERAQTFEIAPMVFIRDESDLTLTVLGQNLDLGFSDITNSKVDISATLSLAQVSSDQLINIPLSIDYHDLSIKSNLKFFTEQGDDVFEFSSQMNQIKANKIAQYLPTKLLGNETHAWIQRGFISGDLEDIRLQFKKNLSKYVPTEMQFNAQLKETELLFNSDWENLKNLDASIHTDGKKIVVMVNSAQLNDMQLEDMTVQILDMDLDGKDVEIIGNLDTKSEHFIQFLRRSPLDSNINETLDQFTLTGGMTGDLKLVVPLDERKSILDIDLKLKDNQLTTLRNVTVKNFNTTLSFHNNEISSRGVGEIKNIPVNIRINPDDRPHDASEVFRVEITRKESDLELYIVKKIDHPWRVNFISEGAEGELEITQEEALFVVNVLRLEIFSSQASESDWDITPYDFPEDLYIRSQNISHSSHQFPNVQMRLMSKDGVLNIHNLQIEGVGVNKETLVFNGAWYPGDKTSLKATAKGEKLSDFLDRLKIDEKAKGGQFDFDMRLFCECAPWNMSFNQMSGLIEMHVQKGVFSNKDPNLGRILSLLNIRSIAKRLRMDVGDLTDKGFTYDDIKANLTIGKSLAVIDHFELNSTSSKIQLTGQSDFIKQSYELEAQVWPAISDAIPIATYLAGGGLAGLGVWAADYTLFKGKILNQIMDEIIEFKYKITGPWANPIIEPL